MRKIEIEMVRAARAKVNWKSGNTEVRCNGADGFAHIYLHGHHIAAMGKQCSVTPIVDTFERYATNTTRSRLRALGINASLRDGCACINGEFI